MTDKFGRSGRTNSSLPLHLHHPSSSVGCICMGSLPMMQLEWCVSTVACASNPTSSSSSMLQSIITVCLYTEHTMHTPSCRAHLPFSTIIPPSPSFGENDLAHMREIRSPPSLGRLWGCGLWAAVVRRSVGKAHEECGAVSEQTSTPGRQTTAVAAATVAAPRMHTLSHSPSHGIVFASPGQHFIGLRILR